MARVKVFTDRGWIEIPPPYTDIRAIENKRFEITTIIGSVSFTSTNEYLSEYGEYMDEREKITYKDKRPKGKWKQISPAKIYECSNCHGNVMTGDIECYEYCHQCGADMRGEE